MKVNFDMRVEYLGRFQIYENMMVIMNGVSVGI